MKRRSFLVYGSLFVAAGCTATNTSSNPGSQPASPIQSSANKPAKLRFAVSDVKGLETLQKDYESLRAVLEKILAVPVEFFPVDSYTAAASALQLNQVDLVLTGPSEYVVIRARTNAVPIVAIKRERYYAVFTAPADRGFKTLQDLKGKKIALWEVGSTSGYLGPIKLLIDAGLDPKADVTIATLHKQGFAALQKGEVDAWGGSIIRYDRFLEAEKMTEQEFPILAKGSDLPADPFVANSALDTAYMAEIRKVLLANQAEILQAIAPADGAKYAGASMIEVNDANFDEIRAVYKAMGQGAFLEG